MVSVSLALVSFLVGFLIPIAVPLLAGAGGIDTRRRVMGTYLGWAETVLGQFAIVWRRLGRPTIKSVSIDDEREVAEVVQSSGTLSDDQKHPFRDELDCKHSLDSKQVNIIPEGIPATIDAQRAEVGHWFDEHVSRGHLDGGAGDTPDTHLVMSDQPRTVDPHDVQYQLDCDVEAEDIKTTERHTAARFEKYGGKPSLKEGGAMLVAFGVGAGVSMFAVYLRDSVIGSSSSGGTGVSQPLPTIDMTAHAVDALVMIA